MEPEGSSPHSQQPATCPCPEPDPSSPCPQPTSPSSILILPSHLRLGLSSGSFPQVSPLKPCMHLSPIRATCSDHLSLLDLITRIFGEYKAPRYVVSSIPLLCRRPQAQISSSSRYVIRRFLFLLLVGLKTGWFTAMKNVFVFTPTACDTFAVINT